MSKVVTLTNRKGGVGKSTSATHIAAGLATLGFRVGLVDTDSQGHCSQSFRLPDHDGLFNVMIERKPLGENVFMVPPETYRTADPLPESVYDVVGARESGSGALYLLPSSHQTYRIAHMLEETDAFLFWEILDEFMKVGQLDIIIVDTNPSLSKLDGAIYLATDAFLYVTECERFSISGVQDAIGQVKRFAAQRLRYLNRPTEIIGIIPNKFIARTKVHRHNIAALKEEYGDLCLPPVRRTTAWVEASNDQQMIYTWAPASGEALDMWGVVGKVVAKCLAVTT